MQARSVAGPAGAAPAVSSREERHVSSPPLRCSGPSPSGCLRLPASDRARAAAGRSPGPRRCAPAPGRCPADVAARRRPRRGAAASGSPRRRALPDRGRGRGDHAGVEDDRVPPRARRRAGRRARRPVVPGSRAGGPRVPGRRPHRRRLTAGASRSRTRSVPPPALRRLAARTRPVRRRGDRPTSSEDAADVERCLEVLEEPRARYVPHVRIAVAISGVDDENLTFAVEAERLGADSLWVAEAWGYDAFTPLALLAARTDRIRL